ncbi:MAG: hypothetical protein JXA94_02625 [Parachlamydiales bacterium]|nr:hypothetical protein [Parachlamydiales bacterium]
MKKSAIFLLITLAFVSNGFSYTDDEDDKESFFKTIEQKPQNKKSNSCEQMQCEVPSIPKNSAYNHPARINICSNVDIFAQGEFLWFKPLEDDLDIAVDTSTFAIQDVSVTEYGRVRNLNFKYKPAFRIALGIDLNHDDWETMIQYTRYNNSITTTAYKLNNPNYDFNPTWFDLEYLNENTFTLSTKNTWKLNFNIFDWIIVRPFYNGKFLTIDPNFGFQAGWIDQSMHAILNNNDEYFSITDSKSWLIGPRVGLNTNWYLADRFKIFGDFTFSLFYQNFYKIKYKEATIPGDPLFTKTGLFRHLTKNSYSAINFSSIIATGLSYGTYFKNNKYFFDISLGYEFQIYSRQNALTEIYLQSFVQGASVSEKPLLELHGLTAKLKFEF